MSTADPKIAPLRQLQCRHRLTRRRLEDQRKNLQRQLAATGEPGPRSLVQEEIDRTDAELDAVLTEMETTAATLQPLLEAAAGADGRLKPASVQYLKKSLHLDDEYIETWFCEGYKALREQHPEWDLSPLRSLVARNELLMAMALVEEVRVLPGEDRDQMLKRISRAAISKAARTSVETAVQNAYQDRGYHTVGRTIAWIADLAAASTIVDDIPADFNSIEAVCVHRYALHVLDGVAPKQSYVDYAKAYFDQLAKDVQFHHPYKISCVPKVDSIAGQNNRPMTASWMCKDGIPTHEQLQAFNDVIATTVPELNVRSTVGANLGHAPYGCTNDAAEPASPIPEGKPRSPISPGHDKLMTVVEKLCKHVHLFMYDLPEDRSKDDATGANSHWYLRKYFTWFGGLGLDALKAIMHTMARQGVEGADHYAAMPYKELRLVLRDIASTNADPATGFGVLRPDLKDYLPAIQETGLVPTFTKVVACLSLFKYVSFGELPSTETIGGPVVIIHYGDHGDIVVPIAKGYLAQPLSEGGEFGGHASVRDAIVRHLGWIGITNGEVQSIINSLFASLKPTDFPMRKPLSSNPFLLVPPCPRMEMVLRPSDPCPPGQRAFFHVRYRPTVYRFDPWGGKLEEGWATEAETLLYEMPHVSYDAAADVEFRQSLPTTITPQRFSASIDSYLKNINHLGFPQGMRDALDVMVGGDISCSAFPYAPVVIAKVSHEIFLFTNVPDDPSEPENTTDQGKSTFTQSVAGTGNLALGVSPVSGSDSAPTLRVLVSEFYKNDHSFFIDEALDISNPNHPLSDRSLKTIATTGIGPSPGIAGANGHNFVYRHPIAFTRKYPLSDIPDIVNRSLHIYHYKLTDATKMTPEEFAYFSSMKFRIQARLNYLAWMYTSGFAKTIYQVTSRRVATRFEGHDGLAGALLGDGTTTDADLSNYKAYMDAANGEKCRAQYQMAVESGVVEKESGRTIIQVEDWFKQCHEPALHSIAAFLVDNMEPLAPVEVWKRIVCGSDMLQDYNRIAASNGLTKVRGGIRTLPRQLLVAAKEGKLSRDDGWCATVKTVTVPTGARTEYVVLYNDLTKGKPNDCSLDKVMEVLGKIRKRYEKK